MEGIIAALNPAQAHQVLAKNLAGIEARISAACARAGRQRNEVTLVAVTKYAAPEMAALLADTGVRDFGESRPQELARKAARVAGVRWHLVGHLQRNKISMILPHVCLIHSVDSRRLLEALNSESQKLGRCCDVLLQFNISREPQKHGFAPEEAGLLAHDLRLSYSHLHARGIMTMAAESDLAEAARPTFREARLLRDRMRDLLGDPDFSQLSMGMTGDFEIAIEEGATLVRLGSALFDGVRVGP